MFGKFKYILKIFKGKVFKFFFAFFADVFGGILFKVKNIGIICAFAILLPCLIYASPVGSGEMVSKDLKGFQVAVDIPGKQKLIEGGISSFTFGKNGVMFQKSDFTEKGTPKGGGGFIGPLFLFEFPGDNAGEESSNQGRKNDETEDIIYHIPTILCCFWLFLMCLYQSQRRANPEWPDRGTIGFSALLVLS